MSNPKWAKVAARVRIGESTIGTIMKVHGPFLHINLDNGAELVTHWNKVMEVIKP